MKNIILSLSFLALLAGCATTENYEKILGTWVGSSERELIQSWGPPSSVYESGGTKYLTYSESASGYIPGTSPTYQTQIIGNTAYTTSSGGSPGFAYNRSCKTTFTLRSDTIVSWRHEGNACVASAPDDNQKTLDERNFTGNEAPCDFSPQLKCVNGNEWEWIGNCRTLINESECHSWGGSVVKQ